MIRRKWGVGVETGMIRRKGGIGVIRRKVGSRVIGRKGEGRL